MEKLDKNMQRRVWNRVYGGQQKLTGQQRQVLQQALRRSEANLAVFEKMTGHETYGEAFRRLTTETTEHTKMLRQMLNG